LDVSHNTSNMNLNIKCEKFDSMTSCTSSAYLGQNFGEVNPSFTMKKGQVGSVLKKKNTLDELPQTVNVKDFLKSRSMFGTNHGQIVSKTPFDEGQLETVRSEVLEKAEFVESRQEGNFFKCYDITDFNSASYVTSLVTSENTNAKDVSSDNTWENINFERKEEAVV
jgi:hypothetical protein